MRIRGLPRRWGTSVSVTAIAMLAACGPDGVTPDHKSTSETTTMTSASAAGTPTPVTPAPPTTQARQAKNWFDLEAGDCLAALPQVDLGEVTVPTVDCATAHQAEVYLRAPVEVDAAIADVADRQCAAGVAEYTGRPVGDSAFVVTYLIDSNQDRTIANPLPSTVICLLQTADGQLLTGSARH